VILGFQNPWATAFYILGMFLLAMHLSHGLSSFLQSLGLNSRKVNPSLALGGRILAWLIFAGYTSIPVAVLLGFLKLP
jgi:succinate dehydrogenase / fumarate reductase cytochrome b subunit